MSKEDIWQWLGPLARRWDAEDALQAQSPLFAWDAIGLSPLAQPLYVDRGVLHLAVANHVVAAELNLLKGKLLARLDEAIPGCGVETLRFHVRAREPPRSEIAVPRLPAGALDRAGQDLPSGLPTGVRDVVVEALAWARARDEALLAAGGWACPRCALVLVKGATACPTCKIERPPVRS
jgi:hypothetical protein